MRYHFLAALTWCTVAGLALGADPPQKKAAAPSKKPAPVSAQKNGAQKNAPQPKAVAKKGAPTSKPPTAANHSTTGHTANAAAKVATPPGRSTASRNRYASYRQPVRTGYSWQQSSPTADRYREIQDALAAKGYLKTPSNGVWDKDSMDAMQRFQTDNNLDPTGKLTARSLGALGLGTKPPETNSSPRNPASPTVSLSASPGGESNPLQ